MREYQIGSNIYIYIYRIEWRDQNGEELAGTPTPGLVDQPINVRLHGARDDRCILVEQLL